MRCQHNQQLRSSIGFSFGTEEVPKARQIPEEWNFFGALLIPVGDQSTQNNGLSILHRDGGFRFSGGDHGRDQIFRNLNRTRREVADGRFDIHSHEAIGRDGGRHLKCDTQLFLAGRGVHTIGAHGLLIRHANQITNLQTGLFVVRRHHRGIGKHLQSALSSQCSQEQTKVGA